MCGYPPISSGVSLFYRGGGRPFLEVLGACPSGKIFQKRNSNDAFSGVVINVTCCLLANKVGGGGDLPPPPRTGATGQCLLEAGVVIAGKWISGQHLTIQNLSILMVGVVIWGRMYQACQE